jgi:hypothetical protein
MDVQFLERFWFGCGHCHKHGHCPVADGGEFTEDGQPRLPLRGGRLGMTVVMVFLLPLVTGIAGAHLTGWWLAQNSAVALSLWQIMGLLGGVGVGVMLARCFVTLTRRWRPGCGEES